MGLSVKNILNKIMRKQATGTAAKDRDKLAKERKKDPRQVCK